MADRREVTKNARKTDIIGVLAELEIDGRTFVFDTSALPSAIKNLKIGKSCQVTVVMEGEKVIGIKRGRGVINVKHYF